MSKGDETRQMILHRAAELFNRKGYHGASLADIMQATGLVNDHLLKCLRY